MAITEYIMLLVDIFAQLGYPGIFVLMVMESATLPVPSEIVLPLGGYLVYRGRLEFWSVVAGATLGSLIGTMIDYGIGYLLRRPPRLPLGPVVRFSHERPETTQRRVQPPGPSVLGLARIV